MSDGGKGDKQRPTDHKKFSEGWDAIFGKKPNYNHEMWAEDDERELRRYHGLPTDALEDDPPDAKK